MTFTYPSHTTKGCVPLSSDVKDIENVETENSETLDKIDDALDDLLK